ncbi:MAG TPA: nitronate monooxygenase [Fimbriiglobus sp.]|nr:nitronate monooxygenase [Fimbriiglobus sp.]
MTPVPAVLDHAARFAASLGLRYPLFQAPVGSIARPELVAAVAEAGGLGALALTWTAPPEARAQIERVRKQTQGPIQANFVLAFAPRSLPVALEAGVRTITFSWGLPAGEVSLVRSFGARLGIQVATVDDARRALDLGADFLICQGVEAGGHVQATRSLWELLPLIVAAAEGAPVIAAGGMGDGSAVARALSCGASAAALGTRFVATRESAAHELYKNRLLAADARDTALTLCFDGAWPCAAHRVLRNSTLSNWEAAGSPPAGSRPGEGECLAIDPPHQRFFRYDDTPPRATMSGDIEAMCLYAGTSCEAIHDLPSVQDLLGRLWCQCVASVEC